MIDTIDLPAVLVRNFSADVDFGELIKKATLQAKDNLVDMNSLSKITDTEELVKAVAKNNNKVKDFEDKLSKAGKVGTGAYSQMIGRSNKALEASIDKMAKSVEGLKGADGKSILETAKDAATKSSTSALTKYISKHPKARPDELEKIGRQAYEKALKSSIDGNVSGAVMSVANKYSDSSFVGKVFGKLNKEGQQKVDDALNKGVEMMKKNRSEIEKNMPKVKNMTDEQFSKFCKKRLDVCLMDKDGKNMARLLSGDPKLIDSTLQNAADKAGKKFISKENFKALGGKLKDTAASKVSGAMTVIKNNPKKSAAIAVAAIGALAGGLYLKKKVKQAQEEQGEETVSFSRRHFSVDDIIGQQYASFTKMLSDSENKKFVSLVKKANSKDDKKDLKKFMDDTINKQKNLMKKLELKAERGQFTDEDSAKMIELQQNIATGKQTKSSIFSKGGLSFWQKAIIAGAGAAVGAGIMIHNNHTFEEDYLNSRKALKNVKQQQRMLANGEFDKLKGLLGDNYVPNKEGVK